MDQTVFLRDQVYEFLNKILCFIIKYATIHWVNVFCDPITAYIL